MSGQLVDATIVAAPKQRNTTAEKQALREGRVPEAWQDRPAKLRQKDRDARWTIKTTKAQPRAGETPMVDWPSRVRLPKSHQRRRRHRLIRRWRVTDAAAHAGAHLADLLDPDNTASDVWADTGYRSRKNEDLLRQRMLTSHVHRKKPPRRRPMPARTARANARKSAVRAHIEHVFAEQKARMGLFVRTIGLARATTKIGLANLVHNMRRLLWLERQPALA